MSYVGRSLSPIDNDMTRGAAFPVSHPFNVSSELEISGERERERAFMRMSSARVQKESET